MATRITQESNPSLWATLYAQWLEEKQPGWIVRGGGMQSWRVVQLTDNSIAFDEDNVEGLYESTGLSTG